ncbi:MAG: ribonuclease J [Eubacterium sp.]|nr:ribonuclease J [Eubacterium sp.]
MKETNIQNTDKRLKPKAKAAPQKKHGEVKAAKSKKPHSTAATKSRKPQSPSKPEKSKKKNMVSGSEKPKKNTKTATTSVQKKAPKRKIDALKIIPIGGLNEIGKNMTVLEYNNQILIVDCGMSFPEDDMYGIDVVIPDFNYLEKNANKIVGLVITHGHEDHIGAIPYLLKKLNVPIYATRITLGLIENKLKERGISGNLNVITAGDIFKLGNFSIQTIRTTHSVADAICLNISTPAATLFHTGDFKIDYTPIDGEPIDLQKFAEIGLKGVDIMLADSTNAVRKGFTKSEKFVGETLDKIFNRAKGRIIIATFSSNVHRVQKIIELAIKYGRKFTVSGRSMDNVVNLAQELGYIKFPKGSYIELNKANNIPDNEMVIITTGSQGEPMSALTRMANDEHKNVKIKKGDMVILSSSPVPGNEKSVSNVVNRLYDKEVDVIYNDIADIHVSGHAYQEELKLIHSLIKPKFFMPVHGESRHLIEHARLAESLGQKKENIFILSNGDQLNINKRNAIKFNNVVSADDILVDGLGVGDVGNIVLKDRKQLSESGLIIIVAAVDIKSGILISGPDIVSRGFVYVKENEDLINRAKEIAERCISDSLSYRSVDWNEMKTSVIDELRKFIYKNTHRSPIILPIFMDV